MNPGLSVIISTKDRQFILLPTLERLLGLPGMENVAEIIVVDDHSQPAIKLPDTMGNVKVIVNKGRGVASARNTGVEAASSPLLLLLDDDMLVTDNLFARVKELRGNFSKAAFNFNWIYPPALLNTILKTSFGRFLHHTEYTSMKGWCKGLPWDDNEPFSIDHLAGATLLISADDYRNAGGFDASFPYAGAEDYDFSKRMKAAGLQLLVDPLTVFYHNEVHKSEVEGFMRRVYQSAVTLKHASELGYKELTREYSMLHKAFYTVVNLFQPFLVWLVNLFKFNRRLDFFSFRIFHVLLGNAAYKGYQGFKA